jgi:hypothetical protein
MVDVFETIDPRGYKVTCSEDQLNHHILSRHLGMVGHEEDIKLTIQDPEFGFIYQDANRPERHIYYRLTAKRDRYIKVVVEFDENQSGRVITAFPTSSGKSGEKLIWTRS